MRDPRGFALPRSALAATGSGASVDGYDFFSVHYGELRNDTGVFAKSGGDGSFSVAPPGYWAKRPEGSGNFTMSLKPDGWPAVVRSGLEMRSGESLDLGEIDLEEGVELTGVVREKFPGAPE